MALRGDLVLGSQNQMSSGIQVETTGSGEPLPLPEGIPYQLLILGLSVSSVKETHVKLMK